MLRRDFVRAVISFCLAPRLLLSQQGKAPLPLAAPVPWTLGLDGKTRLPKTDVADVVAEPDPRFFSTVQMATLTRLAEVLVPPVGSKPGAVQAGTPAFMDFLIGSSPEPRRKLYTGGLGWLELEAQRKYKAPFAKLDDTQADALLRPWLRTWMSDHPPTEAHADFVNIVHDELRLATVNSKAWSEVPSSKSQPTTQVALYWAPIEPDMRGLGSEAVKGKPHVQAVPTASHPMPTYSR